MIHLSVIIPVRNEAEHIAGVLDRLLEQDYDSGKLEIIVVDGLSEDQTPQIVHEYVQKHPNLIRSFTNPKRLAAPARNIGIQNARGEAVLIVDGHCVIDNKDMLRNVSEAFERTGADCLGRPQPLEMANATSLQWAIATARRSPLGHHPDSLIYSDQPQFAPASSVAVAYRKSVFEKVGYFDENFDAAEDVEFNTRCDAVGLKCYFEPAIAVRYVPRKTFKELGRQMQRYGRGRVRLLRKHRHTFSWKSFAPAFLVLGIWFVSLCACLAVISHDFFGGNSFYTLISLISALMFVGLYFLVNCAESVRLALKQKRSDILFLLPGVFSTIHTNYGYGVLREFFFPKRAVDGKNWTGE